MSNIRLYHLGRISENTTSLLSKEHTHYVANVMRLKRGSNINFFNQILVFSGKAFFESKGFSDRIAENLENDNVFGGL